MTTKHKHPVLVVLQLTGGNDYLNTVIPYTDPNYFDNRPKLHFTEDQVLKIDTELGLNPYMAPMKEMYDKGDMAIIHGVGHENYTRSHFRSMDIWHTAEPDTLATEGWLGRATRDLDPGGHNPVTTVSIGQGLPRALLADGVSVASVSDLSNYGMLTAIQQKDKRSRMLRRFANMYAPAVGTGPVMDYLGQTGIDALNGADILKTAPEQYSSGVEYADNTIAKKLQEIAMVHTADLGSRIFYTEHGGFDTHSSQATTHPVLWTDVSTSIADFWDDLREHDAADNVIMFIFSEFGRRVRENGSGTDHGAAGVTFALGPGIDGGTYAEYPDTRAEALHEGDLTPGLDFRSVYTTMLEDWLGLDAPPIVNGQFEKLKFITN